MTKTYQLINSVVLRTTVDIAGKQVSIRFSGGTTKADGTLIRCGTFSTSDPKLQSAIESDSLFGKMYILTPENKAVQSDEPEDIYACFDKIAGITNTQMATEWLRENKGYSPEGRASAADVKSAAAAYNVQFVDWK